jgi:heparin/heparan-sulfate lyase
VKFYTRTFCALNTGVLTNPAILITVDRVESANSEFKKYYVLNSLFESKKKGNAYEVISDWPKNPGKLTMQMLLPEKQEVQILKGEQTCNVFGTKLIPPQPNEPQAKGCRTMFSPSEAKTNDLFVAVMTVGDANANVLPIKWKNCPENIQITVADFLVVLDTGENQTTRSFQLIVPANNGTEARVLLGDLAAGKWQLRSSSRKVSVTVESGKHTAYVLLPAGEYEVIMVQ